jgi:hypothetical protein
MAKRKTTSVSFDRKTNSFTGLEGDVLAQLLATYKGIDVQKELGKMSLWLMSDKGKDRKGELSFIMYWLNRVRAEPIVSQSDHSETNLPLGHLLNDYLTDLWKNSSHIHEFNRIKHIS